DEQVVVLQHLGVVILRGQDVGGFEDNVVVVVGDAAAPVVTRIRLVGMDAVDTTVGSLGPVADGDGLGVQGFAPFGATASVRTRRGTGIVGNLKHRIGNVAGVDCASRPSRLGFRGADGVFAGEVVAIEQDAGAAGDGGTAVFI